LGSFAPPSSPVIEDELRAFDLDTVRRLGINVASRAAVEHLTRPELDGFFVHLDAGAPRGREVLG
jgi:arginase